MTFHFSPRTRILGRSLQFMAGGFAAGLLGGAFFMDIDATVGLAVGGTVATLALIVVFVEWTLSMGA